MISKVKGKWRFLLSCHGLFRMFLFLPHLDIYNDFLEHAKVCG